MKNISKLCICLTTLVSVATPIVAATSCGKTPDKPTENVRFNVEHSEMTSEKAGTIELNWTPGENSLEFSAPTFTYDNGAKSAQVTPGAESRPQIFNLTFTTAQDIDITDGKLSFHCKDKTLQREYDASINNIRLDKYIVPTMTGGSVTLTGTAGIEGIDKDPWVLKRGETIITTTMEIVDTNVPNWITIGTIEGSANYHKVGWTTDAEAGSYTFKVKATPTDGSASVESSEITLTIKPAIPYIDGLPTDPVIDGSTRSENLKWTAVSNLYETGVIKFMQGSSEIIPDSINVSATKENGEPIEQVLWDVEAKHISIKEEAIKVKSIETRFDAVQTYNLIVDSFGTCTCTITFTKDGVSTSGSFNFTFNKLF